jgi:prepilin peptidase CpaA
VAIVVIATITDLKWRIIPNQLLLAGFFMWIICFLLEGLTFDRFLVCFEGFLIGFFLFLPGFLMNYVGAGDVKLMSLVGLFLGVSKILLAVFYISLIGGLVSIAMLLYRVYQQKSFNNIFKTLKTQFFPFVPVISSGVFLTILNTYN